MLCGKIIINSIKKEVYTMKYYCNPMNLEYRYQFFETPEENGKLCKVSREAADRSVPDFV